MRLAIVIPSMVSGGAERVAANLANAWAERGWTVSLISLAPQSLDFYFLDRKVRRIALDLAGDSSGVLEAVHANARIVRALRRVFVDQDPDAVLAMISTTAVLAVLASRGLRCRVVVSEHTYPPKLPIKWQWDLLRRLTYPRAAVVSMLTSEGLRWLRYRIPRARGAVIPNPVPYPLPAGEPVLSPQSVLAKENRLLLAVGRMDKGKQFDCVLSAFAILESRHTAWHLVILGDGPERASLERQATTLGLGHRIKLPGRAGNVGDWYRRAELYVMSSRYEGFPNTLAEAMAYGCPAVSYDCDTGPRDIIRQEVDGLLVSPVGDVPALAEALDRLMGNEAQRARMAARAVEVRSRYSMERILAMWDEVLRGKGSEPDPT
jgi:glycosyltransferase involved in cell wall biosynthesis